MRIEDERFEEAVKAMLTVLERMEKLLQRALNIKQCFEGTRLLDNGDVCMLLGVTKRTLARYRQRGMLPYYSGEERGKCYYKPEDVEAMLQRWSSSSARRKKGGKR